MDSILIAISPFIIEFVQFLVLMVIIERVIFFTLHVMNSGPIPVVKKPVSYSDDSDEFENNEK